MIVIGGGVMGCATALALAREQVSTLVLERSVPGAEASSAAAGMLGAQVEAGAPGPFLDLCVKSRALFADWAASLTEATGIDVEHRTCGILRAAVDEDELNGLMGVAALHRAEGLRAEQLGADELRDVEPGLGAGVVGAVHFPDDARVDPPRLLRALRIAAERAGVEFRSGAMVKTVLTEGSRVEGVRLDDGTTLDAPHVVIAAGSWSSLVEGAHVRAVKPARGQILELRSPSPVMKGVVFGAAGYLCPRDDGRVLVGSTLEFVGYQRAVTVQAVRDLTAAALQLIPGLGGAELSGHWSNFRPYTPDTLPLLGSTAVEGLHLATGHYRNGILLAPITGAVLCQTICEKPLALDLTPFSPSRMNTLGGGSRT